MNFVAIDVETSLGKRWSICQIGLAIVENGEITRTYSRLVQPPHNEYSHWNINVHNITPELTVNEPLFSEIWSEIFPLLEGKKLVAHNASFDIDCLCQTLGFYELPIPEIEYDCTFIKTGCRLTEICEAYEIELNRHHDAACDAEACAKVYINLLKGIKPDFSKIRSSSGRSIGGFTPEGALI